MAPWKLPGGIWSTSKAGVFFHTIIYAATVAETKARTIDDTATPDGGSAGKFDLSATAFVNSDGRDASFGIYLPVITHSGD